MKRSCTLVADALLRHGWWSLRSRFRLAVVVVVLHAATAPFMFGRFGGAAPDTWEMDPDDRAGVESTLGGTYATYLRSTWAGGGLGGLLAFVGVVLAVGGVASERRQGTADLTLSLPVARSTWILARGGLVMGLLVTLAAVSAAVVALGGLIVGASPPVGVLVAATLAAGLGPAYAVAIALLASALTRDEVGAALLAGAAIWALAGAGAGSAVMCSPGAALDVRAWAEGPPWCALLVAAALTTACVLEAIVLARRADW